MGLSYDEQLRGLFSGILQRSTVVRVPGLGCFGLKIRAFQLQGVRLQRKGRRGCAPYQIEVVGNRTPAYNGTDIVCR